MNRSNRIRQQFEPPSKLRCSERLPGSADSIVAPVRRSERSGKRFDQTEQQALQTSQYADCTDECEQEDGSDPRPIVPVDTLRRIRSTDDGMLSIAEKDVWQILSRKADSKQQGCTAVVALLDLKKGELICANTGDSRCVLSRGGKALNMSEDHKPSNDDETSRIICAGGSVVDQGGQARVEGDLNLSRALGDHRYKQNTQIPLECQIISPMPDIRRRELCELDEYIILACDGIWEVHTNDQAVEFVSKNYSNAAAHPKSGSIGESGKAESLLSVGKIENDSERQPSKASKKRKGLVPVRKRGSTPFFVPATSVNAKLIDANGQNLCSETSETLCRLAAGMCAQTLCPNLKLEDPTFEFSGCDNMTFMIVKLSKDVLLKLPENTIISSKTIPPICYGSLPLQPQNVTKKKSNGGIKRMNHSNNSNINKKF